MTTPSKPLIQLSLQDAIAPFDLEVDFSYLRLNKFFMRTFFISGYPRFVDPNWLEPLISFEHSLNISMFIYPTQSSGVLDDLKHKIAEMEATIQTDLDRGHPVDPTVTIALEDARALQEELAKGAERFFQYSLYVTVPSDTKEKLLNNSQLVQSTLGSISIAAQPSILQMHEGFLTTMPLGKDYLYMPHNMDTTSLATTFPFASSELVSPEGIIYGINEHNDSLIIFDRFANTNANSVIFATAGAGKSYTVKLEALRSLMLGTEIIIIDPEKEYYDLAQAVGGDYINFAPNSDVKINPFDLPQLSKDGDNELGRKILSLIGFLKLVLGDLSPNELAVLDRAINTTYHIRGVDVNSPTATILKPEESPLMEDLYRVLMAMKHPIADNLAIRMERFVSGSLSGIFNSRSNVKLRNQLTVFSVRELPDQLRPLAMFMIMDYVWTKITHEMKKRILIVDEAWYMMRQPDSANFLVEIVKRARKYYLGVTTISQDVEDFLSEDRGKEIISNSAMQILLKQAPVSIEMLGHTFNLSQGEKRLLLTAGVGQGLFFVGNNHVAIRVVASDEEHKLITTNPKEVMEKQQKLQAH